MEQAQYTERTERTERDDVHVLAVVMLAQAAVLPQQVAPVLEFPEPGLDDSVAYEGYRTRFYRDAAGNAFQVYLDRKSGRVVHVWANALNESVGFTVRDPAGRPAIPVWGGADAWVSEADGRRSVEYELEAASPVELGHFVLGSMRIERDFQLLGLHRRPFGAPPFHPEELVRLIGNMERLGDAERRRHLALLGAAGVDELRARLDPAVSVQDPGGARVLRVEQPSFDGRNRLILEVAAEAAFEPRGGSVVVRAAGDGPVRLRVRVTTDAAALGPLTREEIFNADFFRFFDAERAAYEAALAVPEQDRGEAERDRVLRFRRLEREVRAAELLSTREKLMAGLPNYATYFGRDMLMTALMMEPIWADAMLEHVIANVLRKLSPRGEVSHEESLGGQAIRENAAVYNALLERYFEGGDGRDALLARAREVLGDLQAVRENYRMVDDDYQLSVVAVRYLADPKVPAERKREFLMAPAGVDATGRGGAGAGGGEGGVTRLALLLRNLAFVAETTAAYVDDPRPENLVGFVRRDGEWWYPGSWRDSDAGYAGGRFAMDVNVIWVPKALEAVDAILAALRELGISSEEVERMALELHGSRLAMYVKEPESLREAVRVWRGAERHFEVVLEAAEVERRVAARLARLPDRERAPWERALRADPLDGRELRFLALSLDGAGRPIPVTGTDLAMRLLLDDVIGDVVSGRSTPEHALRDLDIFLLPYPIGLFIEGIGPVATNDAYAGREVWDAFDHDRYHSPYTVWGREVNLLLLGLARQIEGAYRADGALRDPSLAPVVGALGDALRRVLDAVEASGFKHAELWSYRVVEGRVVPVRYATSTDIQLWNVTNLAVQYRLSRLPGPVSYSSRAGMEADRDVMSAAVR